MLTYRPTSGLAVLAVVLSQLVLGACQPREEPQEAVRQQAITLGGLFALTGDAAGWGTDERRGVELALDECQSPEEEFTVDFVVEDAPATDVTTSVNSLRALIDLHGAEFVIGPTWDDVAAAVAPIADREQVLVLAPDASSGVESDEDYDYFFSIFTPEGSEMRALVDYLQKEGVARVATVYNQDPFSQQWRGSFVDVALDNGFTVVEEFPIADPETQDFRTQIERLKRTNADAVYVEFTTQETKGPFLRQAKELNLKIPVVSSSTTETDSLFQNYGQYLDGLVYAYPSTTDQMEAFLKRYEDRYETQANSPAAPYAFDAACVLLHVLREGHREPSEVRNALIRMEGFDGVTAQGLTFNEGGRVVWPSEAFVIKRVQGGDPEIVKRTPGEVE